MLYKDRLAKLYLLPLEYRSEIADLAFLYKHRYGKLDVDFSNLYIPTSSYYITRRTDSNNYRVLSSHTQSYYYNSFFPKSVRKWNNLSHELKICQDVHHVKRQLIYLYYEQLLTYLPP